MNASIPEQQDRDTRKREAGEHAAELVEPGMVVGLGTGSTAVWAVRRIGERVRAGRLPGVVGVPTSEATRREAERVGIPLLDASIPRSIDLTIDGADELDPRLDAIKGGGGALLREKIVAQASARLVLVVDESKLSPALGTRFALPVEITAFGWAATARFVESLGGVPERRRDASGAPALTDSGNWILDCRFGPIADSAALEAALAARAGVVETGLFLGLASEAIVAGADGVRVMRR